MGWPATLTDAYGKGTQLAYDKKGRLTSHRDPLSRTTTYTYDSLGRMSQQAVDPTGIAATSTFIYDSLDLLRSVDDPKRLRTAYLRNGLGDLLWQRSPDTGESTFDNDTAGSLTMSTTAEGRVARHSYDADNRIVQTTFDEGAPQRYTYDTAPTLCEELVRATCRLALRSRSALVDLMSRRESSGVALGTTPQGGEGRTRTK